MRVVAMLTTYNEERFVGQVIEHMHAHGVDVYLIDNESTDETVAIAERYLGQGVCGIETLPREGHFALREQLAHKEELADRLDADWLIHIDADEIHVSADPRQTLAQALAEADVAGFNAVNFLEFTFVPTREEPDHDHPDFQRTMRSYYPFLPIFPHRLNAWKRQDGPIELGHSGGHRVRFPGLRMSPRSLYMRHYLYISRDHAVEKFVARHFAPDEVADGWFGWRSKLTEDLIDLPSETELRTYTDDHQLDPSEPLSKHLLEHRLATNGRGHGESQNGG
jgi:glycosyltransferase involved in cell wall biosynthesis